jgi:hypothetical protein
MNTAIISWLVAALLLGTSVGLLLTQNWRFGLGLLALQYIAVFWMVQRYWPTGMAAVKLVTGWMSATALGITRAGFGPDSAPAHRWPEGRLFRIIASALIALTVLSATPSVARLLPVHSPAEVTGGLLLIGIGLLQLGMSIAPLRVIIGLLTTLSGFEILYASVEASTLVAALLAVITLGLALVGSYLLIAAENKEIQP